MPRDNCVVGPPLLISTHAHEKLFRRHGFESVSRDDSLISVARVGQRWRRRPQGRELTGISKPRLSPCQGNTVPSRSQPTTSPQPQSRPFPERSSYPRPRGHSFILPLSLPGGRAAKLRSCPLSRGKARLEQVGYGLYLPASNRLLSVRYSAKKLCSLAPACCDLRGFRRPAPCARPKPGIRAAPPSGRA